MQLAIGTAPKCGLFNTESGTMKNPASVLLSILRQLFKDDSRQVRRRRRDACVWRIAPASKQGLDGIPGDGDVDVVRIAPSSRPR